MMKFALKFTTLGFLVAAIAGLPVPVLGQATNKSVASTKTAEKKTSSEKKEGGSKNSIPFRGHILELNKTAKTIKVDKRIFEITSETKLYKAEKPATLEDGVLGEYITGSYKKADDGKLVAHSIYFGGKNKEKAKEKETEKKKEK